MFARHLDPIIAVATASGRGAVGIVRVSGADLAPLIHALFGRALVPRHASYLPFNDHAGQPIDHGIAIHCAAPQSYTGEDVLELQAHGGPVVLQLLLARCLEAAAAPHPPTGSTCLPGLRLARPGEFTERAFLNDKLDLAQAEAVADLIDASTEAAARSASRSLAGAFSAEVNTLRDALIALRMLVEATLDFPEEEIDFLEKADARGRLHAIALQVQAVFERARLGVLLRDGMTLVLAGQPNVGKSSLLNALAGAELAIVTPVAGTTRDTVAGTIQIEGVPVHVIDTAGLRESVDEVERLGVARSWAAIEQADAVVFLHDLTRAGEPAYDAGEAQVAARLAGLPGVSGRLLHVYNKVDAAGGTTMPSASASPDPIASGHPSGHPSANPIANPIAISARTGAGLGTLRQALLHRAGWQAQAEGLFIARTRHLEALRATQRHLGAALEHAARGNAALDLLAEELRLAHDALGAITGAFGVEALLGEIFGRFCIGK